ncbi:MAG TPA: hypothetical protein DCY40_01840 [Actinobacteria bacterium]|nr:hypothetical protein [Actinomycetota bacterium]
MTQPFSRRGDRVRVHLDAGTRELLASLPELLEQSGDADSRLDYRVHADDPAAEARYRELVGDSLDDLRREDRSVLRRAAAADTLDPEEAEAWMRVIGEARLVLAGRLGIVADGWEDDADPERNPEIALLTYLGYLQDRLVAVLTPSG